MPCTICESSNQSLESTLDCLRVQLCGSCGHREAEFPPLPTTDYYEHIVTDATYVASLEKTRRRQAALILQKAKALSVGPDHWIDYGCGRGWFLDELARSGITQIGGYDSSALSIAWLERRNLPHVKASANSFRADWSTVPFGPKVLSFLDVIEHFQHDSVFSVVQEAIASLPSLQWLVVKVPSAHGLLFQLARFLRFVCSGPYRQLFQVGTNPPHFHYFSEGSMMRWANRLRLELVGEFSDLDQDGIVDRIPWLKGLPGGGFLNHFLKVFPRDSTIYYFRVTR